MNMIFLSILASPNVLNASSMRSLIASLWFESSIFTIGFPVFIVIRVSVTFTDSMYFTSSHFPSFVRESRTAFQAREDTTTRLEICCVRLRCATSGKVILIGFFTEKYVIENKILHFSPIRSQWRFSCFIRPYWHRNQEFYSLFLRILTRFLFL